MELVIKYTRTACNLLFLFVLSYINIICVKVYEIFFFFTKRFQVIETLSYKCCIDNICRDNFCYAIVCNLVVNINYPIEMTSARGKKKKLHLFTIEQSNPYVKINRSTVSLLRSKRRIVLYW